MMDKINLRLREAWCIICYMVGVFLSFFFKGTHWVLIERGKDARDNALFFYKYMKANQPRQKIYYIIDRNSPDYDKVKEDSVQFASIKSYFLIASAKNIISTHYASVLSVMSPKLFKLFGLHKKFHFLQHGVTQNDLPMLYGQNAPMCTFICGAKPEYDYVKKVFGHPDGVVQYTGFARFDQLHDIKIKRQILVMPTWRSYIRDEKTFIDSDYYKHWQDFLSNNTLIKALNDNNIQLIFYVHYEMQRFAELFNSMSNNIVIARFSNYDVQTLLKESALLITDYSSVFFDFAYMRKPSVYYQFDETEFFGKHYKKGYFDYRKTGFGDVCTVENEVIQKIIKFCNDGMQLDQKYTKRINDFFPLYDTKNCERIYDIIAGVKNE